MGWVGSIFVGLLTGVLALLGAGVVANACVSWYRISSFEGKSGYFVIGIALLGGIAGLVAGIVTARVVAGGANSSFLRGLGLAWALVAVVTALAAGVAWLLADIPPELGGREIELEVEVRLPAGEATPPAEIAGDSYVALGSVVGGTQRASQRGELAVAEARREENRWIVPGRVHVFTTRGDRVLDVVLGGETRAGFLVPLPGRPRAEHERWSDWLPHPRPDQPPWPDSKASYRFRVRRIEP